MVSNLYGSGDWNEGDFVAAMEDCSYPNEQFKHGDHIRLAWIYLRQYGAEEAARRITNTIRRFARRLGHEEKYHDTITRSWLRLVDVAHRTTPEVQSFDDFLKKHAWLLDRGVLSAFYTSECLSSENARAHLVAPDRRPLP